MPDGTKASGVTAGQLSTVELMKLSQVQRQTIIDMQAERNKLRHFAERINDIIESQEGHAINDEVEQEYHDFINDEDYGESRPDDLDDE